MIHAQPIETIEQQLFGITLVCLNMVVIAILVGKVTLIMQRADLQQNTEEKMLETVTVLKHLGIPLHFTKEILAFQFFQLQTSYQVMISFHDY